MVEKKLMHELISLTQLDIDATFAYERAIEKIDVSSIKRQLEIFKGDHQRHITDLSAVISRLGGKPPVLQADLKGKLIEGLTVLRSITGIEGALKAMKTNEELTNSTYEKALAMQLPDDVRAVVVRNRADERRHLDYITQALDRKIWEEKKRVA